MAKTSGQGGKPADGKKAGRSEKPRRPLLPLISVALSAALLLAFLILTVAILRSGKRIRELDDRFADASTEKAQRIDVLSQSLLLLAQDNNGLRASMGLPLREYPVLQTVEDEAEEAGGDLIPLLRGIDLAVRRHGETLSLADFASLKEDPAVLALLKEHSLAAREEPGLVLVLTRGGDVYFRVRYVVEERALSVSGPAGLHTLPVDEIQDMVAYLNRSVGEVESHFLLLSDRAEALKDIELNDPVREILTDRELSITDIREDEAEYHREVTDGEKTLSRLSLDKQNGSYHIDGEAAAGFDAYLALVVEALRELDPRTEREQRYQERYDFLAQSFRDAGIKRILEEKGVEISPVTREDDYFLYFDILERQESIGSVALEKYNLEIYILDENEVQIASLKSLTQAVGNEKKN